jgi:hypothetical protein
MRCQNLLEFTRLDKTVLVNCERLAIAHSIFCQPCEKAILADLGPVFVQALQTLKSTTKLLAARRKRGANATPGTHR